VTIWHDRREASHVNATRLFLAWQASRRHKGPYQTGPAARGAGNNETITRKTSQVAGSGLEFQQTNSADATVWHFKT
jgi:hypothetical protein